MLSNRPFRRLVDTEEPYPPYAYRPDGKAQLLVPLSPAQVEPGSGRMRWEILCAGSINCCIPWIAFLDDVLFSELHHASSSISRFLCMITMFFCEKTLRLAGSQG